MDWEKAKKHAKSAYKFGKEMAVKAKGNLEERAAVSKKCIRMSRQELEQFMRTREYKELGGPTKQFVKEELEKT